MLKMLLLVLKRCYGCCRDFTGVEEMLQMFEGTVWM